MPDHNPVKDPTKSQGTDQPVWHAVSICPAKVASIDDDARKDRDFRRKLGRTTYSPVYSLVLLVLGLLGLVGFLMWNATWVDHSNVVIQRALLVQKQLLDSQTALRGFYLSHDPAFLEPYQKSGPEIPKSIAALQNAVLDNPQQTAVANEIAKNATTWLERVNATAAEIAAGNTTPPTAERMSSGKQLSDAVRANVDGFLANEYQLRDGRATFVRRIAYAILLLAAVATAAVAYLQCRGIRKAMNDLSASYRDILRLARDRRLQTESLLKELDDELKAVGQIQRSLLPHRLPHIAGLDMAASYQTSRRAGGDYYDFFRLPPEYENDDRVRYGILIADVSGHGTPAAVLMAVTHSIAHGYDRPTMLPNEMLDFVNRRLADSYTSTAAAFVTAFYAIYNPKTRELTYSSAGHNPPRLRRSGLSTFEELGDAQSLPLGVDPHETFMNSTRTLAPGDTLVLYTDGITEARNPSDELLGVERLDTALATQHGKSADILQSALTTVDTFAQDRMIDDRTLLIIRVCEGTDDGCTTAQPKVIMNELATSLL